MVSAEFENAYKSAGDLKNASQDDMLDLYALNKIARGEDISKVPKPGMFDLKGKAKYSKWQEYLTKNIGQADAEKKYVEKFNELKTKYGTK